VTQTTRILFYGDLVTDMVMQVARLPIEANKVQPISSIGIEPGGAGNSLIVAARLGVHAIALGTIGEDYAGEQIYQALAHEGVDVSFVQRGAGSINMTVLVMVDKAGEHVFLVHRGAGELLNIGAAERALICGVDAFFVPGYALHEPRVGPVALDALQIAVDAGVPVFSDLGPIVGDDSLRDMALAVNARSHTALLTEDEALTFTRQSSADDAAHWMQAQGARTVIIKRGGQGCVCYAPDLPRTEISGVPVKVLDTSGAGDSFAAGYIVEWFKHRDVLRAARFANAVGAAKVQKLGTGRQMPTAEEIRKEAARGES
jgi:ribokinase